MRQRLGDLVSFVIYTYAGGIAFWILFWFFGSGNHALRVLMSHYGALLFVLLIPFSILALLVRRWKALMALSIPLGFLLFLAGPYLRPNVQSGAQQPTDLTVLTFNVLHHNQEYDRMAEHIRIYQPDLIAFQETTEEFFAYVEQNLGDQYPYALKSDEPVFSATAIFSRYPVDEFYVVDLGAVRPLTVARIVINGRRVKFMSAHLRYYFGWWEYPIEQIPALITDLTDRQHEQVRRVLADAQRHDDDIVILGCDCNAPETSETRLMLSRFFRNSARESGWVLPQPNLPALGPFYFPQRIDYVFHHGAIESQSVYTIYDQAGSDHAPVLANFRFQE